MLYQKPLNPPLPLFFSVGPHDRTIHTATLCAIDYLLPFVHSDVRWRFHFFASNSLPFGPQGLVRNVRLFTSSIKSFKGFTHK
jgi:hypothetical protein